MKVYVITTCNEDNEPEEILVAKDEQLKNFIINSCENKGVAILDVMFVDILEDRLDYINHIKGKA